MGSWFGNQILTWLLGLVFGGVQTLWGLLSTSFLISPDVTALPQVSAVMSTSLIVVNTCYGLAVITAGLTLMISGTVHVRYTLSDLLPRLVVGFIAANFARPVCSGLTDLANGLTRGLTGDTVSSPGSFAYMLTIISGAGANQGGNGILLLVIGLLLAVLTGMLLCGWYVRLGILIALVAIAPVGLACHGLPYTEGIAKLWWRSMLGCLGVVTVQAFALHSTLSVFSNPQANYPALGLSVDPRSFTNLLIVVCMLWVTIKIPGMMRRFVVASGRTHNPVGLVLRMMIVQATSRLARLPMPRRRAAMTLGAGPAATVAAAPGFGGCLPSMGSAVVSRWRPRFAHQLGGVGRTVSHPRPAGVPGPTTAPPVPTTAPPVPPRPTGPTTVPPGPPGASGRRATHAHIHTSGHAPTVTRSQPQPQPRPKPVVPGGVNPVTAMPPTRPAWQSRTPPLPPEDEQTPLLPPRHPRPRTGMGSPPRRPYRRL